jgi:hypothetical protein
MEQPRKFLFYIAFAGLFFTPVLALFFVVDPDRLIADDYSFVPPCLTILFFETECLGCGMGRAFSLIAHGRFAESLEYNKSGCVIFMLISLVNITGLVYFGQKLKEIYRNKLKS